MNLNGRSVFIAGGSRGLGLALARRFASEGARLSLCARDREELEAAKKELEEGGAEVFAIECDVSDRAQVDRAVAEIETRFGGIDVLVNMASIIEVGPFENMGERDLRRAMDINFWGTANTVLAASPSMKPGSRIVNVTSIGAAVPIPHLVPYVSAKHAVEGFSEGVAIELERRGIRVVTVLPWLMRTGSFVQAYFKGRRLTEFRLFSLGGALPGVAMDPERAAGRILRACRRGERFVVLGLPAKAARLVHALFPGLTMGLMGLANRLLPAPVPEAAADADGGVNSEPRQGWDYEEEAPAPARAAGRRAMRRYRQRRPRAG